MMPICGYKQLFGRCGRVAENNIGKIATGDVDGYGKPWEQVHYLCDHHYRKLLKTLGFEAAPAASPQQPKPLEEKK